MTQSSTVAAEREGPIAGMPAISDDPPAEAVKVQLERILAGTIFARSERLSRFLRLIVEEKVAGRSDGLKEYSIATLVYDRNTSFDPATDTIVRVEARRLRATLEKYYAYEGISDAVWIGVPKGGYEPVFRRNTPLPPDYPSPVDPSSIAVLPFEDFGSDGDHSFCDGITEEIIHALVQVAGLRVAARTSTFAFRGCHRDIRSIGEALDVSAVVEGSVRQQEDQLRITAQLIDISDGYHLWSRRFDRPKRDVFAIQDEIARAVADDLRIRITRPKAVKSQWRHGTGRE